ncbi:uncharacterized protein WCC33_005019 [Rhinophrynus dorsalis]
MAAGTDSLVGGGSSGLDAGSSAVGPSAAAVQPGSSAAPQPSQAAQPTGERSLLSHTLHTAGVAPGGLGGPLGGDGLGVVGFQGFMAGLRGLLDCWDWQAGGGRSGPGVWSGATTTVSTGGPAVVSGAGSGAVGGFSGPVVSGVSPSISVGGVVVAGASAVGSGVLPGGSDAEVSKGGDRPVPISDSAKSQAYVCFEGPLGAHLKQEVRDKIWKREYIDIFTLLPLERFNLDKWEKGKEWRKEEDEDRCRFRLIPRTFGNWLQAFCVLASVIGEKSPEQCSALFCYLDSIWEAHRVYGGVAWLKYDEQFRQRMAVRSSLLWDHKDIGLWLKLMGHSRAGGQSSVGGSSTPFQSPAGGASSAASSAGAKKGCCFAFNESTCKWGLSCRFKHECSGCGGSHSFSRCLRRGKPWAGKRDESGDAGKDAAMAKGVSQPGAR